MKDSWKEGGIGDDLTTQTSVTATTYHNKQQTRNKMITKEEPNKTNKQMPQAIGEQQTQDTYHLTGEGKSKEVIGMEGKSGEATAQQRPDC